LTLVSITRLRVQSLRYLLAFLLGSLRSAREAKNASGNLAVSLLSDAHLAFWTRTLWTDERSMRAFMFAPAHRAVMPKLLEWCDEAAVTHWLQETPEPPSWQEVHRRLQQEGRTSKVDHPSEAQMRFEIPPKKTTRQLTLKSPSHAQGLST
jgi:Domain of unknown function (DUF3291)